MIIRFLGENIKSYLEEFQNGLKTLQRECPNCRGRCNKHGTYYRYVIEQGMTAVRIPIQRMYCKQCHKSHAVIPHILRPYSPYQQGVREAVLALELMKAAKTKIAREYGIHRENIRFWRKVFIERAPEVCAAIHSSFEVEQEYGSDNFWCYLQGIVKTLIRNGKPVFGWANSLANFSGLRVWV
jgi:transposase-like protein